MEKIVTLLLKYLKDGLTPEEQAELDQWVQSDSSHARFLQEAGQPEKMAAWLGQFEGYDEDSAWHKLQSVLEKDVVITPPVHRVHFLKRFRWAAAAILLIIAGAGSWFLLKPEKPNQSMAFTGSIAPGKDGAKLRLSNGRVILIDTVKDGLIAMDGQIEVYKQYGQIYYKGTSNDAVVYNEILTDQGQQWSAQLPDGSTAWVNAASSLRYPLTFSGRERLVTMTGEASFKVLHNAVQPFRVAVKDHIIEDIGTEFNINAYSNEPAIITTVVEGSASVRVLNDRVVVDAGKAARLTNGKLSVTAVDIDQAIAWRKGYFDFEGSDLKTVCRQLERWYNIDVEFETGVQNISFVGSTKRSKSLDDVLDVLRLSGVKFRLERASDGKQAKLVLMP